MSGTLTNTELAALPAKVRMAFLAQANRLEVVEAQVTELAAARNALQETNGVLAADKTRLEYIVAEFRKLLFGKRSEKLDDTQRELAFEELEVAREEIEAPKNDDTRTTPRPSGKRNLGRLPAHLPRIEHVIEPEDTSCGPDCSERVKIGEDVTERLDIVPAQLRVIRTVRPRYVCKVCAGGVDQAPSRPHLIEGGLPTEALIAHVLISKYADHTPLYRQASILQRSGIEIDRSTLAGWVGKASFHLAPIVDRLAEHLKTSPVLQMDETPLPVLDPGRGRTKTGYLWPMLRDERGWGGNDPPGVVYHYAPSRHGKHGEAFLDGFSGILQVDGYSGYNRLARPDRAGGPLQLTQCWVHARRGLMDVYEKDKSPIAAEGLGLIAQIYEIEARIRGQSREHRLAVRQRETRPITETFWAWLARATRRVSPKSRLGEKLSYIAKRKEGLSIFLGDGRVELDTNLVENHVRPQALTRKNALFAGHDEGGRSWARLASLIETCRLNDIEPQAYLTDTLTRIAYGHPAARLDELLPWNWVEPPKTAPPNGVAL